MYMCVCVCVYIFANDFLVLLSFFSILFPFFLNSVYVISIVRYLDGWMHVKYELGPTALVWYKVVLKVKGRSPGGCLYGTSYY